ncbi:VOC family protein [Amycolatopsis sp. NPDC024027]|uniref:VOC family protein n=1 Tax=Amycolatopsis sp. NPDC024027 TaxID=3154327 RepID=UPI00341075A6
MSISVGSILLGSVDPDRLREWYRAALAPWHTGSGFIHFGGLDLLIDGRDDVAAVNSEPGRVVINFHVDDARAIAAHLDTVGVTWLVPLEERPNGLFATFTDPDGNVLQIIQLTEQYRAYLESVPRSH